jgi:hypothetical protein
MEPCYKSSRKHPQQQLTHPQQQQLTHPQQQHDETITRREYIDNKMSDREMISQRGVNPFFQTNYVNDIMNRDMFLKPINTSQEKEK